MTGMWTESTDSQILILKIRKPDHNVVAFQGCSENVRCGIENIQRYSFVAFMCPN